VSLRTTLSGGVPFSSLLLVDVVAIPPIGSPFFRFVRHNPEVLGGLPMPIHESIVRSYIREASHRGLRDEELSSLVDPWLDEAGQKAFYRQIAHFDERFLEEIEQRLDRLTMPVRVLWGVDDAWIPIEHGRRLAALIPHATFEEIDAAGHLMQYDAPVALAGEIGAWLARHGERG
jgi:pimeloyl-ACP methyl ester carboxylesterase